jgi:hypothetical protein
VIETIIERDASDADGKVAHVAKGRKPHVARRMLPAEDQLSLWTKQRTPVAMCVVASAFGARWGSAPDAAGAALPRRRSA